MQKEELLAISYFTYSYSYFIDFFFLRKQLKRMQKEELLVISYFIYFILILLIFNFYKNS